MKGYYPMAVNLTAFWQLQLKGRQGNFFHPANRALKGIGFGLVVQVRSGQRPSIPLRRILRARGADMSEHQPKRMALQEVGRVWGSTKS